MTMMIQTVLFFVITHAGSLTFKFDESEFLFGTNFIWQLTANISNRQNLKNAIHEIASIVAKIVENWRKLPK